MKSPRSSERWTRFSPPLVELDYRMHKPPSDHPNRSAHNRLIYRLVAKALDAHRSLFRGVIYDLGCGEAPYRDWILEQASSYVGVDWSGTLHDLKAEVVADLNKPLPIPDAVADTVFSMSVLEHLHAPTVMLGEACRLLKPGGNLVLQVPWQWWVHEAPHDYFRYSPFALQKLLTEAGFCEIAITPMGGAFTMLALKFCYISKRCLRGPKWLRPLTKLILLPLWWLVQAMAPWFDRLDGDWSRETCGYFVAARKGEPSTMRIGASG